MRVGPAIVIRASKGRARSTPYRIRVEFLDREQGSANPGSMTHFALPQTIEIPSSEEIGDPGGACQAAVAQAIAAAEKAGLHAYRVEVEPNGSLTIVVGSQPPDEEPGPDIDAMAP